MMQASHCQVQCQALEGVVSTLTLDCGAVKMCSVSNKLQFSNWQSYGLVGVPGRALPDCDIHYVWWRTDNGMGLFYSVWATVPVSYKEHSQCFSVVESLPRRLLS